MKLVITTNCISGYEIEAIVEPEIGNAGIGHYEFWGAKGYDSKPCVDGFEIVKIIHVEHEEFGEISVDYPENKLQMNLLKELLHDSDKFFDQVVRAWESYEEDLPEPEYYSPEER